MPDARVGGRDSSPRSCPGLRMEPWPRELSGAGCTGSCLLQLAPDPARDGGRRHVEGGWRWGDFRSTGSSRRGWRTQEELQVSLRLPGGGVGDLLGLLLREIRDIS